MPVLGPSLVAALFRPLEVQVARLLDAHGPGAWRFDKGLGKHADRVMDAWAHKKQSRLGFLDDRLLKACVRQAVYDVDAVETEKDLTVAFFENLNAVPDLVPEPVHRNHIPVPLERPLMPSERQRPVVEIFFAVNAVAGVHLVAGAVRRGRKGIVEHSNFVRLDACNNIFCRVGRALEGANNLVHPSKNALDSRLDKLFLVHEADKRRNPGSPVFP